MARAVSCLLLFLVAVATPATPQPAPAPSGGLTRLLEAELSRWPAKAGVYVKHLATGEEAAVLGDERFNSFSVIKLPLMAMAFDLSDRAALDLAERHVVQRSDFRGGSGISAPRRRLEPDLPRFSSPR